MCPVKRKDVLIIVGDNVRMYRIRKSYTQKELAAISGIDHGDISRVENARINITILTLNHIAVGLEIMAFELLVEH